MATSFNHVDHLLPWLLEVIEANAGVDEIGWSLVPTLVPSPQGIVPGWVAILSVASPVVGRSIMWHAIVPQFDLAEYEFKSLLQEGITGLIQARQEVLNEPGQGLHGPTILGPDGKPL